MTNTHLDLSNVGSSRRASPHASIGRDAASFARRAGVNRAGRAGMRLSKPADAGGSRNRS